LVGGAELALATLLLWTTVSRWAKWVPGFMVLGSLRACGPLLTGRIPAYHPQPVSRIETGLFMVYALLTFALTRQYVSRKPKGFEKVALLVFMMGATQAVMLDRAYPVVAIVCVTIAVAALGLAWRGVGRRVKRSTSTT
jgi:hypothetical protein